MRLTSDNSLVTESRLVREAETSFSIGIAPVNANPLKGEFGGAYRGRRILVTGHTGFKGSWLSHWLDHLGAKVSGFSLDVPTTPSNFDALRLSQKVTDLRGDVRDLNALRSVFEKARPEIVFHLAAQPIVRTSYDDPKRTFDTNVGGTINILECIRTTPSVEAAVLITSDKCYENVEWHYGYRENDRLGGHDPYSASKACAELAISCYIRSYFSYGSKRIASARAGNVIGGGDWAADRIVPDCARAWSNGEVVSVRNPEATRPWQHVLEPLGGYLWLGSNLLNGAAGVAGESYNFGPKDDAGYPVERVIEVISRVWKDMQWTRGGGDQAKAEAGLLKLCCDKALHRLGWKGALDFEEAVLMTAHWYRAYYLDDQRDMRRFATGQIEEYTAISAARNLAWAIA